MASTIRIKDCIWKARRHDGGDGGNGDSGNGRDAAVISGIIKEKPPENLEEMKKELSELTKVKSKARRVLYPITAIVGQEQMKRALILNAINPSIGGVLIRGQKGTAKSTAVRGLTEVLPEIEVVQGCKFNCDPANPDKFCWECNERLESGKIVTDRRMTRVIDLPVGATEDRVVGSLDIEKAIKSGVEIRTSTTITGWENKNTLTHTSSKGLGKIKAQAILLATGCRERPRFARMIPGSRPQGVFTTGSLQRFVNEEKLPVGKRAVIVGAELVSLSALETLKRAEVQVSAMITELPQHQIHFPYGALHRNCCLI